LQRLIVAAHLRTAGVPGQGVDGPLLYLVINSLGPDPPPGCVFAIWLRLRQNVLGRANARTLRATSRQIRRIWTRLAIAGRGIRGRQPCRLPRLTALYPTAELHASAPNPLLASLLSTARAAGRDDAARDHLLVTDNVHRPSRKFCKGTLAATALKSLISIR